jgi:NTE family protein
VDGLRARIGILDRSAVAVERLAVVLGGGGGARGLAWQVGVLAGVADAGLDLRAARTILGTRAGAVAATRLAAGLDPRDDADLIAGFAPPPEPSQLRRAVASARPQLAAIMRGAGDACERRRRAGQFALRWRGILSVDAHVAREAARLPQVAWPDALVLVAVDADTGERVVLDRMSDAPLAVGVAATRAVPGLVSPVPVAGRRLLDGALGSSANADLLPAGHDLAVVVLAAPEDDALAGERASLQARGTHVVAFQPGPADLEAPDAKTAVRAGRGRGATLAQVLAGLSEGLSKKSRHVRGAR